MKPRILWIALLFAVLATLAVYSKMSALDARLATVQGDTIVSLELAFSPSRAEAIIDGWEAVRPAAWAIVHWDWIFILGYVSSMMLLAALATPVGADISGNPVLVWLWVSPALAAFLDIAENAFLYLMLGIGFWSAAPLVAILAALKFLAVIAFAVAVLRRYRSEWKAILLIRFSLLMVLLLAVLATVPQWREVLLGIAEAQGGLPTVMLGLSTFFASLSTWYSARVMYRWKLPSTGPASHQEQGDEGTAEGGVKQRIAEGGRSLFVLPEAKQLRNALAPEVAQSWKTWLPRIIGGSIAPVIALTMGSALDWNWKPEPLIALGAAWFSYIGIVSGRRKISLGLDRWLPAFCRRYAASSGNGGPEAEFGKYESWSELPCLSKGMILLLGMINLITFLLLLNDPLLAQSVGSAPVALWAITVMTPIGTWLVYWGERLRLPILLLLLAIAGLSSFYNDNHWVRLTPEADSTDAHQTAEHGKAPELLEDGLEAYVKNWAEQRAGRAGNIPLFIVSAEGGGIRAAYWTAAVLARLQEENRQFARYVFALSGVSGGSLGATLFSAQVAEGGLDSYQEHAHRVLSEDFLAPTIATLLFPDLAQRFYPWPVFNDRAMTLEQSWEAAWSRHTAGRGSDRFARPFVDLWRSERAMPPLLFLNSTVVETGGRLIMQPLNFNWSEQPFKAIFNDAVDGRAALGTGVPLSTAVHLSARFTYVSPAGSIQNLSNLTGQGGERNPRWLRLVDGGYFENSAAVTARELLAAVEGYMARAELGAPMSRLRPFVIHISNEPVMDPYEAEEEQRGKQSPMGELLSPLWALLNARPARGIQARDVLFGHMAAEAPEERVKAVHFYLRDLGATLPLGWMLSSVAKCEMRRQLGIDGPSPRCADGARSGKQSGLDEARTHNRENIDRISSHIRNPGPVGEVREDKAGY